MNKREAIKAGKDLLKQMVGKGWKLRVWENLGWHYSVYNHGMNVHQDGPASREYSVLLADDGVGSGGLGVWTDTECRFHSSPNAAVRAQMRLARSIVDEYSLHLAILEDRLGITRKHSAGARLVALQEAVEAALRGGVDLRDPKRRAKLKKALASSRRREKA